MKNFRKFLIVTIVILLSGTIFYTCTRPHVERIAYALPQQSPVKSLNFKEVKTNSTLLSDFKILKTGEVLVPRSGVLNEKRLPSKHSIPARLWVEVYAFLFKHPSKGWFMIDTGLDSSFRQKGNIKGWLVKNYIKKSKQAHNQNIIALLLKQRSKLQASGKSLQIKGVFFTHLHGDHTAGLPEINPQIPLFIGKGAPYHFYPLLYTHNHFDKVHTLHELDTAKGVKMGALQSVLDVFGDQSLLAIATPGHTKGHLSYLLMTQQGPILLTGDASHTKYGFQKGIAPGWADNRAQAQASLQQLRTFAQNNPEVKVIYGHER